MKIFNIESLNPKEFHYSDPKINAMGGQSVYISANVITFLYFYIFISNYYFLIFYMLYYKVIKRTTIILSNQKLTLFSHVHTIYHQVQNAPYIFATAMNYLVVIPYLLHKILLHKLSFRLHNFSLLNK